MAAIFYRRLIKGRLYPRTTRTHPNAFADEVSRFGDNLVLRLPERHGVVLRE